MPPQEPFVRKGVGWATTDILCISVLFFGRVRSQSRADPLWIPLPLQAPPTTEHPAPQPLTDKGHQATQDGAPQVRKHDTKRLTDGTQSRKRDGDPTRLPPAHEALRSSLRRADAIRRGSLLERRRPPRTSHGLAHVYPPGSRLPELSHSLSNQTYRS